MKDKFTIDFDSLAQRVLPKRAYRLADVENRIERVAYDLVRFRDNEDTDQLWKVQEGPEGPVIVALYGDDGSLTTQSQKDWEAVPDKTAMHIYYKGEPIISLGANDLGIPAEEFGIARRWLPTKLAESEDLQKLLLGKATKPVRKLIAQRFPELTKVATPSGELYEEEEPNWEDEMEETELAQAQEYLRIGQDEADAQEV